MKMFTKENSEDLNFKKAVKKPIPVECIQIMEPFQVVTIEGTLKAKSGDWLMKGIQGELYACDATIFNQTYDLLE